MTLPINFHSSGVYFNNDESLELVSLGWCLFSLNESWCGSKPMQIPG